MSAPIFVVVCENDQPHPRFGVDPKGPLVAESYTSMTIDQANELAARLERFGACRVGRVVFDDPAAEVKA
jgi:hypothetical protein